MTRKEQNIEYKPILDACCGGKMFYFDKDNPNVLFQDIRDVDMTLCDGRSCHQGHLVDTPQTQVTYST